MAQLIPVLCKPVVPGDRFKIGLTYQMQLAPMYNPVYDGLTVNFEAFFVPNRIIDKKWREFWTGYNEYDQMTQTDIAPLTIRTAITGVELDADYDTVTGSGVGRSSLLDYLGFQFSSYLSNGRPASQLGGIAGNLVYNAFPVLGYHRIFDDWYRNERTQRATLYDYYNNTDIADRQIFADVVFRGSSYATIDPLLQFHVRNYAKDRFTTALPEPVIGGDVRIPVNDNFNGTLGSNTTGVNNLINTTVTSGTLMSPTPTSGLNALALGTIAQLKAAFKEYEFEMKDTYNGNRYVESIEAHYGVRVPDSTLQRSLYLGSARDYVNFGEVYQTSAGDGQGENGALGDYAGRGASNGSHYLFDETFYEPGYMYIIFSVSPKARYFQGVQRHFYRYERDDYFSPEFQNIGDDFISNYEIYNDFNDGFSNNNGVFGYQTRWYDLKSYYDELHGDFAQVIVDYEGELDTPVIKSGPMMSWTFSRYFAETPVISSEFSSIPIINRPFIETDVRNDNYFVDIAFDIQALRPILTTESF